jgi:hypothetical protein
VLGICIEALAIHDWDSLRTSSQDDLSSMIGVMFIAVTPANSRQTKSSDYTWSHKTFPPPLGIGMSIATDTTAFITRSYAIAVDVHNSIDSIPSQEYSRGNEETDIAIQCPSRNDLELLLPDAESCLDAVNAQIKCLQEKGDLDISEKEELVERLEKLEEIKRKRQDFQVALDYPRNAIAGYILHISTSESQGTRGKKMD